jgi:AcrR family transcriptional regulator
MEIAQANVRDGTALRRRGKDRVQKILNAARLIFLNEGYAGLSMRRVADAAGISLGNLSYYFSSKANLFESVIEDVLAGYNRRWEEISSQFGENPAAQLDMYLDFLFADCRREETQQFFYQFWAVSTHDDFVSTTRERIYEGFHAQLLSFCKAVNPDLNRNSLRQRVYLLVAMIEGLHVVFGNSRKPDAALDRLRPEFKRQVRSIINA